MELAKYEGNVADLQIVSNGSLKVLTINDKVKVPLFETVPFWGKFVQLGSVKENKRLKGHAGHFYFPKFDSPEDSTEEVDENEVFSEKLRLLLVGFAGYTRALMPKWEPGSADTTPICSSRDGIWPSTNVELPMDTKCGTWETLSNGHVSIKDTCPSGMWDSKNKIKIKPACRRTENWVFFDLDRKCPIMLSLAGVNVKGFKALYKKMEVLQLRAITKGLDLTNYHIQAKGEEVEGETFHKMTFNFAQAEDITPSDFLGAVAWYQTNVLPVLGVDPVNPRNADDSQQSGGRMLSAEDEAALQLAETMAAEDAANFDV